MRSREAGADRGPHFLRLPSSRISGFKEISKMDTRHNRWEECKTANGAAGGICFGLRCYGNNQNGVSSLETHLAGLTIPTRKRKNTTRSSIFLLKRYRRMLLQLKLDCQSNRSHCIYCCRYYRRLVSNEFPVSTR